MLTQEFDRETMRYLSDILAQEKTTCDELICTLIRDRWLLLQQTIAAPQTLERPTLDRVEAASAEFNIVSPEVELPPSEVALLGAPVSHAINHAINHRPRNPKQALADFVKRRNQRVCVF